MLFVLLYDRRFEIILYLLSMQTMLWILTEVGCLFQHLQNLESFYSNCSNISRRNCCSYAGYAVCSLLRGIEAWPKGSEFFLAFAYATVPFIIHRKLTISVFYKLKMRLTLWTVGNCKLVDGFLYVAEIPTHINNLLIAFIVIIMLHLQMQMLLCCLCVPDFCCVFNRIFAMHTVKLAAPHLLHLMFHAGSPAMYIINRSLVMASLRTNLSSNPG